MGKPLRTLIIAASCAIFLLAGELPGSAEPTLEETRKLLQKGLTLYELDQEIARLTSQEIKIGAEIIRTGEQIESNQVQVAETRDHAGKVLRAYYMGDRDQMWMLLFSAKSLTEALSVYEYLSMIIQNDHHALNAYSDSYKSLVDAKKKLEDNQQQLGEVKEAFIAQREKALAVQQEIDAQLKASAEAEALLAELVRFTTEWKERGLPLFRKYLSNLSQSMQGLPELLEGKNGDKYLKDVSFTGATFEISDTDLMDFFRSKNPVFQNLQFQFADDKFIAKGGEGDIQVEIEGLYTLENDPVNHLQFHVARLSYNGFTLPETSNRALEEEFNLGFTPSKYHESLKDLKITSISLKDGKLSLKLKFK